MLEKQEKKPELKPTPRKPTPDFDYTQCPPGFPENKWVAHGEAWQRQWWEAWFAARTRDGGKN